MITRTKYQLLGACLLITAAGLVIFSFSVSTGRPERSPLAQLPQAPLVVHPEPPAPVSPRAERQLARARSSLQPAVTPWSRSDDGSSQPASEPEVKCEIDWPFASDAPSLTRRAANAWSIDLAGRNITYFAIRFSGAPGTPVKLNFENIDAHHWRDVHPLIAESGSERLQPTVARVTAPILSTIDDAAHVPFPDATDQRWTFVRETWVGADQSLGAKFKLPAPETVLVLRVPYRQEHADTLQKDLQGQHGVEFIDLAPTPSSFKWTMLRLFKPGPSTPTRPCVLIYSAESSRWGDGGWMVDGLARFLVSDQPEAILARSACDFLLVPSMDIPANGSLVSASVQMDPVQPTPHAAALAAFLQREADAGRMPTVAIELFTFQSALNPLVKLDVVDEDATRGRHGEEIFAFMRDRWVPAGVLCNQSPQVRRNFYARPAGWMARCFGTVSLILEINSLQSARHVVPDELRVIGAWMSVGLADWARSPAAADAIGSVRRELSRRASQISAEAKPVNQPVVAVELSRASKRSGQ